MNLTTIEKLTASVITNFIAQHFNNEVKHTTYYKHNLKKVGNLYAKELEKAELKEFDLLDERQPDALHLISSNQLEFIEEIVKRPFTEMALLQNIIMAYKKEPKRIEGIVNKILNV
jgi:hypothetical protein